MIVPDIEQIWQEVKRRTSKQNRSQILIFRKFLLNNLDNPHASVLTGYPQEELPDEKSVEELQGLIIAKHRNSRDKLSQWLAICYLAVEEMRRHGHHLSPNALAPYLAPSPSPFASLIPPFDTGTKRHPPSAEAVSAWREALYRWIQTHAKLAKRQEWEAAILLSAILHGALLDNTKINLLLGYLNKNQKPSTTARIGTYCFNLPYEGLGDYHLQRWVVDPITELMILKQPTEGTPLEESSIFKEVAAIIGDHIKNDDRPRDIHEIIRASRTWWSMRTAQIDVQGVSRQFYTHAFRPETWARLFNEAGYGSLTVRNDEKVDYPDEGELSVVDETKVLFPWLSAVDDVFDAPDKADALQICKRLINEYGGKASAPIYLDWLRTLLQGESSSGNPLKLSTIKKRFEITTLQILGVCGDTNNFAEISIGELEDIYSDLTSDHNPIPQIKHLTQGLRDFHRYLVNHHGQKPIRSESEILGNDYSLKPVNANLISFDDYHLIQAWIAKKFKTADWLACKLVCMLAFKCGMRRMEIFGLRLDDIQTEGPLTIVLRPHFDRGLKTSNSQRIIPARLLLSLSEINFLKDWIANRKKEIESGDSHSSPHLFPEFSYPSKETWVDRIYTKVRDAIRAVTDDKHLYLHHLRHAFGTWHYLRLRAPDYPMVSMYFENNDSLKKTNDFLRNSRRARVLLMGPAQGPRRGYAYAVAKLLGHASPAVSMGHYIHAADLFLGSAAWRECRHVPKAAWISISTRGKSVIYDRLTELSGPAYFKDIAGILAIERKSLDHSSVQEDISRKIQPTPKISPYDNAINTRLDFETCRQIYDLAIIEHRPLNEISTRLQVPTQRIASVVETALNWVPELGLKEKQLYSPRIPEEKLFFQEMEKRLHKLSTLDPALLASGLAIHLKHYYPIKSDVVFRNKNDLSTLETYLSFVNKLCLKSSSIRWELRYDNDYRKPPEWAATIIRNFGRVKFHNFGPQSLARAKSYSEWIGLTFLDQNQKGCGTLMATAAFLSMISLKS